MSHPGPSNPPFPVSESRDQYSSGSKNVVTLRLDSAMTQSLSPATRYEERT